MGVLLGRGGGVEGGAVTQILSSNLRLARRAGEKMTHSQPNERQRHATKMAMLNKGVEQQREGVNRACGRFAVFPPPPPSPPPPPEGPRRQSKYVRRT